MTAVKATRSLGLILGCLALVGCAEPFENATCGDLPSQDIDGFSVRVATGSNQSDADIYFCVDHTASATPVCGELDHFGEDDFREGSIGEYSLSLQVPANSLRDIWLENRGTSNPLVLNIEWGIASLTVVALLADGTSSVVYEDSDIVADNDIDAGERYVTMDCNWQ